MIEIRKPDATLKKLLPPVVPRPEIKYIPSQYAIPFSHNGKDYVFQNLTKQCIEGTLPVSARAGEGFDDLIAAQFLVPEKIRDARHLIEEAGFKSSPFMGLGLGFRANHCMADGDSVVIAPDGSLYPLRALRFRCRRRAVGAARRLGILPTLKKLLGKSK